MVFELRRELWKKQIKRLDMRLFFLYNVFAFLGSSVVEQAAVNRLVAGSNPARGAL